jgi:Leucine-rich repeat (LRR) protein
VFQDFTPEFAGFEVKGLPPGPPPPNARPFFITPLTDAEVRRIAALPAADQVEAVRKELVRRNPGFDGKMEHKIEDGVVTELRISTEHVTDISPVRAFDALRILACIGTGSAPLADLTSLKGMHLAGLTQLDLSWTKVGDTGLAQFNGCNRLTSLALCGTGLNDAGLAHSKDCTNLTFLELGATQTSDTGLAYFKGCKSLTLLRLNVTTVTNEGLAYFEDCKYLTDLGLGLTQVTDAGLGRFGDCKNLMCLNLFGTTVSDVGLAHFKDCKKLTTLNIQGTKVIDLSLLKGMPLRELWCDFRPERDAEILRAIKTLEKINDKPAAEFWKGVEKK